jgi:hypothetical protein
VPVLASVVLKRHPTTDCQSASKIFQCSALKHSSGLTLINATAESLPLFEVVRVIAGFEDVAMMGDTLDVNAIAKIARRNTKMIDRFKGIHSQYD